MFLLTDLEILVNGYLTRLLGAYGSTADHGKRTG